jgi:hypothetical protein
MSLSAAPAGGLASLLELAQVCSMEKRPTKSRDDNNKWTDEENKLLTALATDGSLTW